MNDDFDNGYNVNEIAKVFIECFNDLEDPLFSFKRRKTQTIIDHIDFKLEINQCVPNQILPSTIKVWQKLRSALISEFCEIVENEYSEM